MTLTAGTKLGPYQIVSAIGAGGMGEVYKATDTRLDRTVAIKVLPEHLAQSPERRERFEREAKAISQLNHPNICTLHDLGRQDAIDFLVMEYIEGETLAERLAKGSLPRDHALAYGAQIADGLGKAHRAGIVHRDLKPANVMLTKPGVKLLDFGVAKLMETESASDDSNAPTLQKDLTRERAIVGTPRYMAPEQLAGGNIDARTDIYAFGLVLREMLTDRTEPPPAIARVLSKCLAEDPDERWQTAHDLADELRWIASKSSHVGPTAATSPRRLNALATAGVTVAILASAVWWFRPVPGGDSPRSAVHFRVDLPDNRSVLPGGYSPTIALCRDGEHLLVRVDGDRLYLRSMHRPEAEAVPGTDDATVPFFSWDGATIAFYQSGEFRKVPLTGGASTKICEAPGLLSGASWGPNGVIVFSAGASGLWKVSAEGGVPEPLTTKGEGDIRHRWPQFLPGGETVLFTLESTSGFRPALVSLATGEYRVLEEAGLGRGARFLNSGHIVYAEEGVLYALAFDSERLEIQGRSVPVLEGVYIEPDSGLAYFTSSETSLSYVSDPGPRGEHQLLLVDRSGAAEPLVDEKDFFRSPRYSPDGTKIAVGSGNQGRHLWVYDLQTGARDRLTSTGLNAQPVWTPDGNRIAFARLYVTILLKSVGTEGEDELHTSEHAMFPSSMTPDGATLAFYEFHSETRGDIWMLPLAGKAEPWLVTEAAEIMPRFSPDGGYVAYASNETGRFEIYVKPYPEPGEKVPVSSGGGTEPIWSPDGRELFYRNGDTMMVVTVEREPSFHTTRAEEMFSASYVTGNVSITYDVAPDGQHFAMIDRGTAGDLVGDLYVVTDWSTELEKLVPTDNGR